MDNIVFKALAEPKRRQILRMLRQQPMTTPEISAHFTLAGSTLAKHLGVLKRAALIQANRKGNRVLYNINLVEVEKALAAVTNLLGKEQQ